MAPAQTKSAQELFTDVLQRLQEYYWPEGRLIRVEDIVGEMYEQKGESEVFSGKHSTFDMIVQSCTATSNWNLGKCYTTSSSACLSLCVACIGLSLSLEILECVVHSSKAIQDIVFLRVACTAVGFLYHLHRNEKRIEKIEKIRRIVPMMIVVILRTKCPRSLFCALSLARVSEQLDLVVFMIGEIVCSVDVDKLRGRSTSMRKFLSLAFQLASSALRNAEKSNVRIDMESYKSMMGNISKVIRFAEVNDFPHLVYSCTTSFMLFFHCSGNHSDQETVELIRFLHNYLGSKGICGFHGKVDIEFSEENCRSGAKEIVDEFFNQDFLQSSNRILLELKDKVSSDIDAENFILKEMVQCYRCLYQIEITSDTDDHQTEERSFCSPQSAEKYFDFVLPWIENNQTSAKEIVKLVAKVNSALEDPELEKERSYTGILQYLEANYLEHCDRQVPLCVLATYGKEISNIQAHFYFLQADSICIFKLSRRGTDRPLLLEHERVCRAKISSYIKDLTYNPRRWESWFGIAETFRELVYAILDNWNFDPNQRREHVIPPEFASLASLKALKEGFFQAVETEQQRTDIPVDQLAVIYAEVYRECSIRCFVVAAYLARQEYQALGSDKVRHQLVECNEELGFILYNSLFHIARGCDRFMSNAQSAQEHFKDVLSVKSLGELSRYRCHYMLSKVLSKLVVAQNIMTNELVLQQLEDAEKWCSHQYYALYRMHAIRLKLLLKTMVPEFNDSYRPILVLVSNHMYDKNIAVDLSHLYDARVSLYLDCLKAMERILEKDKYFHQAAYMLAVGVNESSLLVNPLISDSNRARISSRTGPRAAQAIFEKYLFDKRRPQVVNVWVNDSSATGTELLRENYQRRQKFNAYRVKYFNFYLQLLEENKDFSACERLFCWVSCTKEGDSHVLQSMMKKIVELRCNLMRQQLATAPAEMDEVSDIRVHKATANSYHHGSRKTCWRKRMLYILIWEKYFLD